MSTEPWSQFNLNKVENLGSNSFQGIGSHPGQRVSVDFEILPDPNDGRSVMEILDQIENALRNSNSVMRSGSSGFLLDGATFETFSHSASVQESYRNLSGSPVFHPKIAQAPAQFSEIPRFESVLPAPPAPILDAAKDKAGELLGRITELLKVIDETKADREKTETEMGEVLKRLSESENAVLMKIQETDQLRLDLDASRKETFYAIEELEEAKKSLSQAKEMWMKESTRATRLREQLDKSENIIADQKKELIQMEEKFKKTETENANLKHLINKSNEVVSTRTLTPQVLENSFPASDSYFARGSAKESHQTQGVQLSSKYLQLCVNNDGVLYEDEVIQIGIKAKFTGLGEGVLGVYFGNKTSGILQNFQTKYILDSCGPSALHLTASPLPNQLGPKSQVCQRVSVQISSAFTDCPRLTASFLLPDNTPKSIPLRLPVVISKFIQGKDLLVEEFFSNWRQQLFLLNEASSVVNVCMNLAQIARATQLGGALTLHHQVDETPDNIVLVGQFPSDSAEGVRCATIPEVLVLARIEVGAGTHSGKARVAVRSNDAIVADSVRACLAQQISAQGL